MRLLGAFVPPNEGFVAAYLALEVDVFDVFLQPFRILDTLKRSQLLQQFVRGQLFSLESLERRRDIYINSSSQLGSTNINDLATCEPFFKSFQLLS